jgi:hypothetical protein
LQLAGIIFYHRKGQVTLLIICADQDLQAIFSVFSLDRYGILITLYGRLELKIVRVIERKTLGRISVYVLAASEIDSSTLCSFFALCSSFVCPLSGWGAVATLVLCQTSMPATKINAQSKTITIIFLVSILAMSVCPADYFTV